MWHEWEYSDQNSIGFFPNVHVTLVILQWLQHVKTTIEDNNSSKSIQAKLEGTYWNCVVKQFSQEIDVHMWRILEDRCI